MEETIEHGGNGGAVAQQFAPVVDRSVRRQQSAGALIAALRFPVIKNLLRWSKISMLDVYGHVMTDEKIAAQGSMLERIMPKVVVVQ